MNIIDDLQLAEIENFLKCNLRDTIQVSQNIENVDPKAAFLYPILLQDRLEVISKIPGQPINHYSTQIDAKTVLSTIESLEKNLKEENAVGKDAIQIYNWLLKPIEEKLENSTVVDTLVFVPDNAFRNIPLSVLLDENDGTNESYKYVLQKDYATVVLPSSQIFDLARSRSAVRVLAIGISESQTIDGKMFDPLPSIEEELQSIERSVPIKKLLNTQATEENIYRQIQTFQPSTLHFTTHGNFSSDPDETFIVIYDDLLRNHELDSLLAFSSERGGFDLLSLAACKTAEGDSRAVLGLSGIAVRAGARSTLATLWNVSEDTSKDLMTVFYRELQQPNAKAAEAFHKAQLSIADVENSESLQAPYLWAPFIFVGNWL